MASAIKTNEKYHITTWQRGAGIIYGENKKDLVEIIKKLCGMKSVRLIEGKECVDYIHMYVATQPKYSDRHFWARVYYVVTVGNVNEDTIVQYIQEQEENDKLEDR